MKPDKLLYLLQNAGLPVRDCDSEGGIVWLGEPTEDQLSQAQTIIQNYDPNFLTPDEQDELDAQTAKTSFRELPQWATWQPIEAKNYVQSNVLSGQTSQQVSDWLDANVTTLANAKVALKMLAVGLVTLRDIAAIGFMALLYLRDISVRKM